MRPEPRHTEQLCHSVREWPLPWVSKPKSGGIRLQISLSILPHTLWGFLGLAAAPAPLPACVVVAARQAQVPVTRPWGGFHAVWSSKEAMKASSVS